MSGRHQYLAKGHLAAITFLSGFVVFDIIQFFDLFFDSNRIDTFLFVTLFLVSTFVSHKYLKPERNIYLLIQVSFLTFVALNGSIKDAVLLYPGVLGVLLYITIVLSGTTCAVIGKKTFFQDLRLNALFIILFAGLGVYLGYITVTGLWIKSMILLDAVVLLFVASEAPASIRAICFSCIGLGLGYSIVTDPTSKSFPSQKKFHDKVIFSAETPFQRIDITSWKGNNWFYFNNINQLSTLDEWMYYEAMVHPVMHLTDNRSRILVVGGEKGIVVRELGKYNDIKKIYLLAIDTGLYSIAKEHPVFTQLNKNALMGKKIELVKTSAFRHLNWKNNYYDVIIVDAPDPVDLEMNQYYTKEFYKLCHQALTPQGAIITQAGSPYYATKAFHAISRAMRSSGFNTLPLHNQVITMGEWGWVIGSKSLGPSALKKKCNMLQFGSIGTKWLNNESMQMMMSFGKPYIIADSIEINKIKNPVIHEYYRSGTWNFE